MKQMASRTTSGGDVADTVSPSLTTPISTQTSSPFFRLPRELRDRIYAYAMSAEHKILWPTEHLKSTIALPLLLTSHTIHDEALPFLYSANRFEFAHPSDLNMFIATHPRDLTRRISNVYLYVKDRDLRAFWTAYLSSTAPYRSLVHDLPGLRTLHIRLRSQWWMSDAERAYGQWHDEPALRHLCMSLEENTIPTSVQVRITSMHRIPARDYVMLSRNYVGHWDPRFKDTLRTAHRDVLGAKVCLELDLLPTVVGA